MGYIQNGGGGGGSTTPTVDSVTFDTIAPDVVIEREEISETGNTVECLKVTGPTNYHGLIVESKAGGPRFVLAPGLDGAGERHYIVLENAGMVGGSVWFLNDGGGGWQFYGGGVAVTTGSGGTITIANGPNGGQAHLSMDVSGNIIWLTGAGSPEGVIAASVGSLYTRTDGGAGTTLYVKESGTSNTGWVAK